MIYKDEAGSTFLLQTWEDHYGKEHAVPVCHVCLKEFPETKCDYCYGVVCAGCWVPLEIEPPLICCDNCIQDMPGFRRADGQEEEAAEA